MNLKHTAALLLIAGGVFAILVGGITAGVGLAEVGKAHDQIASELSWRFVEVGALVLAAGVAALVLGILVYRRSDHRMPIGPGVLSAAVMPRFPLLSPVMGVLLLLTTALVALLLLNPQFDWWDFRVVGRVALWAMVTALFLLDAVQALLGRRKSPHSEPVPIGPGSSPGKEA